MNKRKKFKLAIGLIIGTIISLIALNYFYSFDAENVTQMVVASIGGVILLFTATVSSKTNNQIDGIKKDVTVIREAQTEIKKDHDIMRVGMLDISESFNHKKEIVKLCQTIENETSGIFEGYSEVNTMLRDYIIGVNEVISMIIEKQYEYGFDEFDSKYFKTKILNKVSQLTEHINYVMIDKNTFEKINDKVIQNIRGYITELKYVKGLENGERRKEFKELTLKLTKKITKHSIDIYNRKTKTA